MSKSRKNLARVAATPVRAGGDATVVVAALVLVVALTVVYAHALPKPFIYDDAISVSSNPSIRQLWPLWGTDQQPGPLNPAKELPTAGRPLVNLSFALNYAWGGLDPTGYRAVNLAIHFLSAILLMLIVRRTLRLEYFAGQFDRSAGPLALAVSLLWAIHPLQTEPVAYITQRTELLMAFCYLATLYSALSYLTSAVPNVRRAWLTFAVIACAAGMASKEVMVSAPLVVLLFDWTFVTRSLRRIVRDSWQLYAGLAATWLLLFALNFGGPRSSSAGFHLHVSPWTWWATQAQVFWMYLKLAIWPWPLVIHYELPLVDIWTAAWPWLFLTVLVVISTLILLWSQRPTGFVAASILMILAPTSIVPIVSEVAAERRMYLPLAPLLALVVVGAYCLLKRLLAPSSAGRASAGTRPLAIVVVIAAMLAFAGGLVSTRRLAAYENMTTLWQDTLLHQPDNFIANYNLACCLNANGQTVEAIGYFERAVQLRPNVPRVRISLGDALVRVDRPAEAIPQFEEAVRLTPDDFPVYARLAQAYVSTDQPTQAVATAEQAARLARAAGQTAALNQIEAWLADYRARQATPLGPSPTKSVSP